MITMSANVDKMFSVRQPVWWQGTAEDHGQAEILDDYPQTWDEARRRAGLDWEPVSFPALMQITSQADLRQAIANIMQAPGLTAEQKIHQVMTQVELAHPVMDGWQGIANSETHAPIAFAMDSYEIIGHGEFGEIFSAVLGTDPDNLNAETGGVLEGGRKVWMLISLDEPVTIPGDDSATYPFMALTARHDAKAGVALRSLSIRIVCANTFNAAEMEGERTGLAYTFRHTANWRDKIDDAREAVTATRAQFRAYVELMEHLTGIKVTEAQREQFITAYIPAPPAGTASDRVLGNVTTAQAQLREILAGPTVDGAGIGGSVYGLVQGAGEYLDHVRKARSWETKVNRSLLRPEAGKQRALSMALEVAGA
jgi:phage/plasmid-like protein (TIGR03299 family)